MTLGQAGASLRGLVKGRFKGIEVTGAARSPRIVAADVIGTRRAHARSAARRCAPASACTTRGRTSPSIATAAGAAGADRRLAGRRRRRRGRARAPRAARAASSRRAPAPRSQIQLRAAGALDDRRLDDRAPRRRYRAAVARAGTYRARLRRRRRARRPRRAGQRRVDPRERLGDADGLLAALALERQLERDLRAARDVLELRELDRARTREPTGSGAGKRTLLSP